jgi:hypothetical protein
MLSPALNKTIPTADCLYSSVFIRASDEKGRFIGINAA